MLYATTAGEDQVSAPGVSLQLHCVVTMHTAVYAMHVEDMRSSATS